MFSDLGRVYLLPPASLASSLGASTLVDLPVKRMMLHSRREVTLYRFIYDVRKASRLLGVALHHYALRRLSPARDQHFHRLWHSTQSTDDPT